MWEKKKKSSQLKGQQKDLAMLGMSIQANTNRSLQHDSGEHASSQVSEGGQVLFFHGVVI